MRKIIFFVFLIALVIFNCKGPSPDPPANNPPNNNNNPTPQPVAQFTITITPSSLVLSIGESAQFTVEVRNTSNEVVASTLTLTSNNTDAVSFDVNNVVTAVAEGYAKIQATYETYTGETIVFVNPIPSTHLDKTCEWYRTQNKTGYASNNNCGPTSTHMAIKWFMDGLGEIPTVETIRNLHPNDGGWWYTTDIIDTLNTYNIPIATHAVNDADDLYQCLERGNIAVLCIDTTWLTYDRHHFYDRFYGYRGGHFLVIKGFSEDGEYFICHDPNSWTADKYGCGVWMGRNRYYKVDELLDSITRWWSYLLEIGASASTSTVDIKSVPEGFAGPFLTGLSH